VRALVVLVGLTVACRFESPGTPASTGDGADPGGPIDASAGVDAMRDAAPDAPPDITPPAACLSDPDYVANPTTGRRYFASTVTQPWATAQTTCESTGAQLAVIDDAAENTHVDGLLTGAFWIGMTDLAVEGTWLWVTGASVDAGFTSWRAGNPNNENGVQHCGEMDPSNSTWNDFTCPSAQRFVCECPG